MLSEQASIITRLTQFPHWLKVGAVLAVLIAVCGVVGFMVAGGQTLAIIVFIAGPALIIAAMFAARYFELLILLIPITAVAFRFVILPTGTGSPVTMSLALTLGLSGLWFVAMLARRQWDVPHTSMNRSLFIFIAIVIISMPWGILWRDPILNMRIMGNFMVTQTASLLTLLCSMWLPFLIGRFVDQPWKIRFFFGTFIVAGTLMTISQFFNISHTFLNDRGLWSLWYITPLTALLLTYPGLAWYWRLSISALIPWHLFHVAVTNSSWVSGWLPTFIGLLGVIFLHSRKLFFILLILPALYMTLGPGREYVEQIVADESEEGALERLDIWSRSLGIVSQHWVLGTGPAGYAPYNMTYFPWDARSTHNNYFDILAQFGTVGFLVWFWFMFASLWFGWKTIERAPPGLLRMTAITATAGWGAALCSMMLGDWILPFAYNQGMGGFGYTAYSWIFLGLLVSVHRLIEAPSSQAETVTSRAGQTRGSAPTP